MKREEAIQWLTNEKWKNANNKYKKEWNEAFDMAIEALHREETEAKGYCHRIKPKEDANCDCVAVVRCKDCRHAEHREQMPNQVYCKRDKLATFCAVHDDDDFCKYGELAEQTEVEIKPFDAKEVFSEMFEHLPKDHPLHKEADAKSVRSKCEVDHDREWIIGCIKHDGFIHTHRFDKANQIILDALDHHTETETNVDTEGKHGRLIDAEWLLKGVSVNLCDFIDCGNCPFYQDHDCLVMLWIDNAPTVEVGRPCKTCGYYEHECPEDCEYGRPHGEWLKVDNLIKEQAHGKWLLYDGYYCSNCHHKLQTTAIPDYCPNCDADMRGDNNDE